MFLLCGNCAHWIQAFPRDADFGDGVGVGPADGADEGFGCVGEILFPEPVVGRRGRAEGFHGREGEGGGFTSEPFCGEGEVKVFLLCHDESC